MSQFDKEYDNHESAEVPPEELLEAFEVFQVIPLEFRAVYLLRQCGVRFPQIAEATSLDIDDVELQHENAENALYQWVTQLLQNNTQHPLAKKIQTVKPGHRDAILEFLSDIIQKLLFFDETDSPPQLEEIATIIFWVRKTLGFYALWDRQIKSANVLSVIPHMTPPEMRIADRWLFSLDASERETIMLSQVADIAPPLIAEIQGISEDEVSLRIVETEIIQERYTRNLLKRWLQTKQGRHDTKALSPDEAKAAKLLWKRLSGPFREILHKRLLGDDFIYFDTVVYEPELREEEKNFEVADDFLQSYFGMLVLGWCQIALNGMRDENTVRRAAAQKTLQHKKLLRNFDSIAFAVRLLDYEVREAFLLSWSLETEQIARHQNTAPFITNLRIQEARMVLHKRFGWIVTQWFRKRSDGHDAIKLRPSEKNVARLIVKRIPKRYRDALSQSLLTNHSNHVIAKDLGLSLKTVTRYVTEGKAIIANMSERLICEYFWRTHKGMSVAEKFLNEMYLQKRRQESNREKMTPDQRKNAILDELKTILSEIPIDDLTELRAGRVAFFLTRGCGVKIDEIPDFYGADATYLRNAYGKVVKYLHKVAEQHVFERLQQSNPFITPSDFTGAIGSQAMKAVSREQLEIYRRYHVSGESEREIAESLSVSEDVVSKSLAETRTRFHEIVEEFMTVLLNRPLEYRPEFQALNQDITTALTTQNLIEQNRAIKGKTLEIPASDVVSLETAPAATSLINGVIESVPGVPLHDATPTRSMLSHFSWRNTIASVPKLLTPLFGLPTFDSATKTLWGTVSNAFMLAAIPFLWVMSLLVCGQLYGIYFVRNAETLEKRHWIVRQLFWIYALIFNAQLGAFVSIGVIEILFRPAPVRMMNIAAFMALVFLGAFFYTIAQVIRFQKTWSRISNAEAVGQGGSSESESFINQSLTPLVVTGGTFEQLKCFVNAGLVFTGVIILSYAGFVVYDIIIPFWRHRGHLPYESTIFVCLAVSFLIGSIFLFQYLLKISKDEKSFQKYPPIPMARMNVKLHEFLCILPFAFFQ